LVKTAGGKYVTVNRLFDAAYLEDGTLSADGFGWGGYPSELIPVYRNGEILHKYTLDEIRTRVMDRMKEITK